MVDVVSPRLAEGLSFMGHFRGQEVAAMGILSTVYCRFCEKLD